MPTKLSANLVANVTSQIITIVTQFATAWIFLKFWNATQYGSWILLSAIPAYIALLDFGFSPTLVNAVAMSSARGSSRGAQVSFSKLLTTTTCAFLAVFIVSMTTAAVTLFCELRNEHFNNLSTLVEACSMLTVGAAFGLWNGPIEAAFRRRDQYAFGVNLINLIRATEWIGGVLGICVGRSFISTAAGSLAGRLIATCAVAYVASRGLDLRILPYVRFRRFKSDLRLAMEFLYFPIGNALTLQAVLPVIAIFCGPAAVVTFSCCRTLARSLTQVHSLVNRSFWPEFSRLYGLEDIEGRIRLARRATAFNLTVTVMIAPIMCMAAPAIFRAWVGSKVNFDIVLFSILLCGVVLTAVWQSGWVELMATNTHSKFARFFLVVSIMDVALVTTFAAFLNSLHAVAMVQIAFELAMIIALTKVYTPQSRRMLTSCI